MGNALGHLGGPGGQGEWVPNIPVQNDPNQPYSQQMWNMVLHFSVPLLFIGALAYTDSRRKQQELSMQDEQKNLHSALASCKREQDSTATRVPWDTPEIAEIVKAIETKEDQKYTENMKKVESYDEGLKTILDIKCSWFKKRTNREQTQEELVAKLFNEDADVNQIISYRGLKDIYKIDANYCGDNREENGKLRQLYVQLWKSQMELQKYKNIVEKLKRVSSKT